MAPKPIRSPDLELREPELPPPLRIVKRGQTFAGCSSSREVECGGRGISSGSEESRGSPPMTIDRPLTVHKRRGARGTVLNGRFDEPSSTIAKSESAISDLIKKATERAVLEDPDLTPKPVKQLLRTVSAGAFLKSEFHSPWVTTDSDEIVDRQDMAQLNGKYEQISPPKLPERRLSKSKAFLLKLGGRKDKDPISLRSNDLSNSKKTLVRRLSRGTDHFSSESTKRIPSENSYYSLQNKETSDVVVNSRISSYNSSALRSLSPISMRNWSRSAREEFILCPEITITPEVLSLDAGSTNLWVAVEVTGTLRSANNYEQSPTIPQEGRRTISGYDAAHLRKFGRLDSMRIDLITTRDSSVLDVVGNLHELKTCYAGETHLIVVKLRISKVRKGGSHVRESSTSDEIMADLEKDLGGAITTYLTVRLTYNHSGFLNYNSAAINSEGSMSSHTTKLQTEASALIKRHNLQSAWSPRASREMNGPLDANPLVRIIEMHLPTDKAREAIRRLADDRVPIPKARRFFHCSDGAEGSSEDTVKVSVESNIAARIEPTPILQTQTNSLALTNLSTASSPPRPQPSVDRGEECEIDPARKIWAQMRRQSRGKYSYRTSIMSDSNFLDDSDECSPSHLISADIVGNERKMIKDTALRNKRSVGTDTLKSFAPSVAKAKTGGMVAGVGLGVGRSWWVGGNWW